MPAPFDLHSLVQCQPLTHILCTPEGYIETLFLEISCLQSPFKRPSLQKLKHLVFWFFSKFLEITYPVKAVLKAWDPTSAVFWIYSCMGVDFAFKDLINFLLSKLAFSKKQRFNYYLFNCWFWYHSSYSWSQSLFKKTVKISFEHFITLVNALDLFPDSSTMSQIFKTAVGHCAKVW